MKRFQTYKVPEEGSKPNRKTNQTEKIKMKKENQTENKNSFDIRNDIIEQINELPNKEHREKAWSIFRRLDDHEDKRKHALCSVAQFCRRFDVDDAAEIFEARADDDWEFSWFAGDEKQDRYLPNYIQHWRDEVVEENWDGDAGRALYWFIDALQRSAEDSLKLKKVLRGEEVES